jgi:predicted alpha-1,2-mannosidase
MVHRLLLIGAAVTATLVALTAPTSAGAATGAASATGAATARTSAQTTTTDPAGLVNPLIGTSGGVNDFPGPDMPFGMIQWSPDTAPSRPDGGGYSDTATQITGYSLTHLAGPGCTAYGDVPILPITGAVPSNPTSTTESFTHAQETAQAGYYENTLGNGVTVRLTDTTRAGIGTFAFPAGTQDSLLLKVDDSQSYIDDTQYQVIGDNEVQGEVEAGHFCGNPNPSERDYTLHFDITFSAPFTVTDTWNGTSDTGATIPGGLALTFGTNNVKAKVGVSFTSTPNAVLNRQKEIPSWNFAAVRNSNKAAWNQLLDRIQVSDGTTDFYTALYHSLLYPSTFSDVNGQYMGFDGTVHTTKTTEYANFSGWDIYRGQTQLAAMIAPKQTSDAITSMLNDYAQTGALPKWSLGNGETYVQVGDPADAIIADAYAFGARDFNVTTALKDMVKEATTTNDIRPGQQLEDQDGYLPFDGSYGCCNFYGPVSTQLEYDADDYAIATLAKETGDNSDYRYFATRAQNWENVYNAETGYVQARNSNGTWLGDFSPSTPSGFVEGTSAIYTAMVPFALSTVIKAEGGDAAWVTRLNDLLGDNPANAGLGNEPSLDLPYEYDYAGAAYLTQSTVREIEQQLYDNTEPGNDDLGTLSAAYVWDELGMYPETPGTSTLALASPAFSHIVIDNRIVINAPGAPTDEYVDGLTVNGRSTDAAYVTYGNVHAMTYSLTATPDTAWGSSPPSDPMTGKRLLTSAGPASGLILAPGATGNASYSVENLTNRTVTENWTATPPSGVTLSASSGTVTIPPDQTTSVSLTVTAGSTTGSYAIAFSGGTSLNVDVAAPGDVWPYYNDIGVSSDGQDVPEGYDGSGYTYSANALATNGLTPGANITVNGVGYTWPDEAAGTLDSIWSAGQVIPLSLPAGTTTIGLLGSAIDAGSGGATGTLTVSYTDGSTQQIPVTFADWTLGAGADTLPSQDTIVATTSHRNLISGPAQQVTTYIYATSAALESGETVASVTLPTGSGGDIGVFAIGAGSLRRPRRVQPVCEVAKSVGMIVASTHLPAMRTRHYQLTRSPPGSRKTPQLTGVAGQDVGGG